MTCSVTFSLTLHRIHGGQHQEEGRQAATPKLAALLPARAIVLVKKNAVPKALPDSTSN